MGLRFALVSRICQLKLSREASRGSEVVEKGEAGRFSFYLSI